MIEQYLVTVGITTYNSNLVYLSNAIDSATNQTYRNIEIIISDDGSNNIDEIENLIKNKKDKRITLLKNKQNSGVSNSLNNIINFSKGDYFSWCPDDDYMHLSKIELQVRSLESEPQSISICNHFQVLDIFNIKRIIKHAFCLKFVNIFLYLVTLDRINGGSLLIPASMLKDKKFNLSLKHVQDYDMWIKLFYRTKYVYLNRALFYSRQHSKQASKNDNKSAQEEISEFYLDFFKNNMHNLIYYFGKKTYLLIIMSFEFRDIKKVVNYFMEKNKYQKYILNFYNKKNFFLILIYLFKISGRILFVMREIKNFFLYKFFFKLLKLNIFDLSKNEKF